MEVVHTDGFVLLRYQDLSLTGPIDADGDFAAGGLFDMTTLVSEGDIVTRIDGEFGTNRDGDRGFEATLRHRLRGSAAVELGSPDSMQSVDCTETFSVRAQMR